MAISVMSYHLIIWLFFELNASTLIGRLGLYAVAVFFILSGLSMAIVYNTYIKNEKRAILFFVRRIFRIWPLLWICIVLVVLPNYFIFKEIDVVAIVLNITTAFGFIV